jgi:hypothetical protein
MANSDSEDEVKTMDVGFKKGGDLLNKNNKNKNNDDFEENKNNKRDDNNGQSGYRKFVPPRYFLIYLAKRMLLMTRITL